VFAVQFTHGTSRQTLSSGQHYALPRMEGFRDTPASDLRALIAEIETGRPWREAVASRYAAAKPWLHRIITDPTRTRFFDAVLPPGDGPALDIGAGWGQITRPLAARRPVVAVEPVAERLGFIQAAARQDGVHDHIAYLEADYLEVEFSDRFAVICAIGVLEWAGAFQNEVDPQERQRAFLRKIRRELAHGGALILGIENRLGLKYLLGCPDDHLGVPHIACLPAALARPRWRESSGHTLRSFTYSLDELAQLLRTAGFEHIDFFAAFPDYKLPECIIPFGEAGQTLNSWLKTDRPPPEHNGHDGSMLDDRFQHSLGDDYRALANKGVAHHFIPSFFVRAS
jgi:2-polyprenyl-3-methyl-5-hydroxy-6-metoxy-1,4-benzoquinol methylase